MPAASPCAPDLGLDIQVPLGPWGVDGVLTMLTLVIETLVVRHYGLTTVFIKPLTILLAEAGQVFREPITVAKTTRNLARVRYSGPADRSLRFPRERARIICRLDNGGPRADPPSEQGGHSYSAQLIQGSGRSQRCFQADACRASIRRPGSTLTLPIRH